MRMFAAAVWASILVATLARADDSSPERQATENGIRSTADPAVRIDLPQGASYAGAHRWTLYGVADCELHLFVEADEEKRVRRLYWIQFEGYLPTKPHSRYNYSKDAVVEFSGRPFHVNASASELNPSPKPGSDYEQVQRLLRTSGYALPDQSISVRLVNLFDANRKELMLIYSEDLAPTGLAAADLKPGGKAEAQWIELQAKLLEAARKRIQIEWSDGP